MTPLYATVEKLRPPRPGSDHRETVFLADEHAGTWSRLRDHALPLDLDTAERYARACGGTAQILSAADRERLLRERQPALPGLSRFLDP